MIRLIMFITKGPTDPKAVIEFTDWQQVESFGRLIGVMPM
jgi:menaquinone-dependent protoporphyrinogen oxidase